MRSIGGMLLVWLATLPGLLQWDTVVIALSLTQCPQLQRALDQGLLVSPHPSLYVLGTVHIGSESADEVTELIEAVKPNAVVLEVSPSRLKSIRRRNEEKDLRTDGAFESSKPENALRALPALAERGWSTAGISGLLFASTVMWPSLIKRSFASSEEAENLPRRDEFAAAVSAADTIGARIVPADFELEELLAAVAGSVSPAGWLSLGANAILEHLGFQKRDPIRRQDGETIVEWAARRRRIETARASRKHGEQTAPQVSRILVESRDARFAASCAQVLSSYEGHRHSSVTVVCIVGLVHVDGILERLLRSEWKSNNVTKV